MQYENLPLLFFVEEEATFGVVSHCISPRARVHRNLNHSMFLRHRHSQKHKRELTIHGDGN
jgi:hypothetical protein